MKDEQQEARLRAAAAEFLRGLGVNEVCDIEPWQIADFVNEQIAALKPKSGPCEPPTEYYCYKCGTHHPWHR